MSTSGDDLGSAVPVPLSSLMETPEEILAGYREMPYQEFLQTSYWAIVKNHLIEKMGKCQLCSARNCLAVHHNTYENHGHEHFHLEDLVVLCERCHMYFHRTKQLGDGVPPLYRNTSFDNFLLPTDDPIARRGLATVLMAVKNWVRAYPFDERPGLLLIGDSGTGKTHLAAAAFHELARREFRGLFYDYQDLAERLGIGLRDGTGIAELEVCRSADLLFLDDIGSQRYKDWMEDALLSVIKYRCNHRKAIIATTSLRDDYAGQSRSTESIEFLYEKRLAEVIGLKARSRLFEMCRVLVMPSSLDYRLSQFKGSHK